jgi:hypothetical protein
LISAAAASAAALAILTLASVAVAQDPAPPPVAIPVEPSGEEAALVYFNREITTLRARIMGRNPDERRALAVKTMDDLVTAGETGPVEVTQSAGGNFINVGRRVIVGLTEIDLAAGDDLGTASAEAASRVRLALVEAGRPAGPACGFVAACSRSWPWQ